MQSDNFKNKKLEFVIKCPECEANFQRLICFREGWVVKPPPVGMEISDNPEGWKYWVEHLRGF
ncbi:hypothetical protein C5F47_06025 [Nitrosopumilus cobalaminigenes]|uniref:Uncharacterized protein n=1 Tax=Nitrosopumilus cobalaminigenes TaxID=1470066 RepID=A0A7D5R1D4_9ARCH|nr:hypothetical protein [Nitrosopumilus cobalaminigenes]QLH03137.1 hypothetical protein C5F47_06025 [Nitrosopumilus cobalaminigenes]